MQNKTKQGQKAVSPVLNTVAKWVIFVLNSWGRGLKASAAQLYPDFPWVTPLPLPGN